MTRSLLIPPPEPWVRLAECTTRPPDLFYPEKGESSDSAKEACAVCTVTVECLAWALEHRERYGVWAGTTPEERRALEKGRVA